MARYEFSDILYEIKLDNLDDIKGHETELSELVFKDFQAVVEAVNPKYDLDIYSHYYGELDAFFIWYPDNLNKLEEEMDRGVTDGLLTEFNKIVSKHLLDLTGKKAIVGTVIERHRWSDYDDVDVEGELADDEELLSGVEATTDYWELKISDEKGKEVTLLTKKENRDTEVSVSTKWTDKDAKIRTIDFPEEIFTNGYAAFYIPLSESYKLFDQMIEGTTDKTAHRSYSQTALNKLSILFQDFWNERSKDNDFLEHMTLQGDWERTLEKRSLELIFLKNGKSCNLTDLEVGRIVFTKKE